MKRRLKEAFIDSILVHVKNLQTLKAVDTQCKRKLSELSRLRKNCTNPKTKQMLTHQFQCWALLENRIKITFEVYLDSARREQEYLMLPEFERVGITRYRYLAGFQFNALELRHIKGFDKLVSLGWYNKDTNLRGVVKDHRLSVKFGFDNKLDPVMLGHPANCEFLTVKENARKSSECSLSVLQLQKLIEKWEK